MHLSQGFQMNQKEEGTHVLPKFSWIAHLNLFSSSKSTLTNHQSSHNKEIRKKTLSKAMLEQAGTYPRLYFIVNPPSAGQAGSWNEHKCYLEALWYFIPVYPTKTQLLFTRREHSPPTPQGSDQSCPPLFSLTEQAASALSSQGWDARRSSRQLILNTCDTTDTNRCWQVFSIGTKDCKSESGD